MPLTLPSNVKQVSLTGYEITDAQGNVFLVGATSQAQLDTYVTSVNTGVPTNVTVASPNGTTSIATFNPGLIVTNGIVQTSSTRAEELRGGTSSAERYNQAQAAINNTVNIPSNLPLSPAQNTNNPPVSTTASSPTTINEEFDAGIASSQQVPTGVAAFGLDFEPNPINVQEEALSAALREQQAIEDFGSYAENPQPISDEEYDASISQRQFEDSATVIRNLEIQAELEALQQGSNVTAGVTAAQNSNTTSPFAKANDWRVRISLAPSANYLYQAAKQNDILYPLRATNGVLFPYTPQINVTYSANYDSVEIVHSNYKLYNYRNSAVDNVNIVADFTAQDTVEANYLLAVIHFFRSATKMFFGQDTNPIRGVPPPLCYLSGHGTFGFDNHPIAITSFTMNYPNDVDYINAGPGIGGTTAFVEGVASTRLRSANLRPGGLPPVPKFTQNPGSEYNTRVPTKLQLNITCLPIITRKAMSNLFSLEKYATGQLLRGSTNPYGGGIW